MRGVVTSESMLKIGFATPLSLWESDLDERHRILESLAQSGVDHVYMADHVSFRGGHGTDGFVEIAALSQLHPTLGVMISVYLLPLRHPLPVARQLQTMNKIAPDRVMFGVGIGGDDRHEVEVCGVDPRTRGRRTDEMLGIIRSLMRGDVVTVDGEFFRLDDARIIPAIDPPIPVIVGGRSDAALRRAALHGDGWIGAWCSPRRYTEALTIIDMAASEVGRQIDWQHGYQPWVGIGDSMPEARNVVKSEMESFYGAPFETFEKYTPYGTPADVAAALRPYVDAGCSILNLKVCARSDAETIAAAAEIAATLRN